MMDIYQHFRKEEEPFIDKVLSWKEQVEISFQPKLTDFLDPREQQIVEMVIGTANEELQLKSFGGTESAERARMIIAPFYEEITRDDFRLTMMEAAYHEKFITMEHPDVMGAFLSQGVKRNKLGDIFVGDGVIQIILAEEITTFMTANLTSIKKANVTFSEKPFNQFRTIKEEWQEELKTVASLRLDAVLKEIYHLSRKDAGQLIESKLVKVNYRVADDKKFQLQDGDLISVRGKGRSKLVEINGKSKKDKWKITIAILK